MALTKWQQRWCPACKREVAASRRRPGHVLHGTLTAVTLAAWAPIYGAVAAARASQPLRCAQCQSKTLPLSDQMRPEEGNGRTWRDSLAATPAAPVDRYTVIGGHPKHGERKIWETTDRESAEQFFRSGVAIDGQRFEGVRIEVETSGRSTATCPSPRPRPTRRS